MTGPASDTFWELTAMAPCLPWRTALHDHDIHAFLEMTPCGLARLGPEKATALVHLCVVCVCVCVWVLLLVSFCIVFVCGRVLVRWQTLLTGCPVHGWMVLGADIGHRNYLLCTMWANGLAEPARPRSGS